MAVTHSYATLGDVTIVWGIGPMETGNLLSDLLFRVRRPDKRLKMLSLPEVLVELGRAAGAETIESFVGLRPHQQPAWHAFLVQLGAIALGHAGLTAPPNDAKAGDWAGWLRALTPGWPHDAPWCLIAPPIVPAFLQPPVPDGDLSAFKGQIGTPDALDMLITAKNHDLKSAVMVRADPDDWIYALVSLQTQEGYLGA